MQEIKKEYYSNGSLFKEIPLTGGIKNGIEKTYYPNGAVKQEIMYKNGQADGLSVFYYQNGIKQKEVFYIDGVLCSFIDYDENGQTLNTLTNHHTDV